MAQKLTNSRGWTAHSYVVKEMLGLPAKAKLPPGGLPPRKIQGITVWVNPLGEKGARRRNTHRVMAICPDCSHIMSAGRLHQHKCPTN